jgi:hypothetical protein
MAFAQELEACSDEHVRKAYHTLICDLILGTGAKGNNGKALAMKLGVLAKEYQKRRDEIEVRRKRAVEKLPQAVCSTFNHMKDNNAKKFPALMIILGPTLTEAERAVLAERYKTQPKELQAALEVKRAELKTFFCAAGFPKSYAAPGEWFKALQKAEEDYNALQNEVGEDPNVFQAYLACIKDDAYWFETNELCLAGLMREQPIRIFAQSEEGEIRIADQVLTETAEDIRLIFHRGQHFMRCSVEE